MAKQPIPMKLVTCTDGTQDIHVGLNTNTNPDDKVQAYVDAFRDVAQAASTMCYNLPLKLILAIWGCESGWATATMQYNNQNWANMIYTSSSNPPSNIGKGQNGWAKFEGKCKFSIGFAGFFMVNPRYSALITYLNAAGTAADIQVCLHHIANAGYGGDPAKYIEDVNACITTLENRTDIK